MHAHGRVPGSRGALVRIAVLALLAALVPVGPLSAHADPAADAGLESAFLAAIERERAAQGLAALVITSDLTAAARRHSGVMADRSDLHHNPRLGSEIGGWIKIAENVGRGATVDPVHDAFMASSGHRRNILDPAWTQVGIGVVVRDGQLWVTQVFRQPEGETATPEPDEPKKTDPQPKKTDPQPKRTDPQPQPPEPEAPAAEPAPPSSAAGSAGSTTTGRSTARVAPPRAGKAAATGPRADETAAPPTAPADPVTDAAAEAAAEPARHEDVAPPLAFDRLTLTLARQEASERSLTMEDVLT